MTETKNSEILQVGTTTDFKNKKWTDGFFWGLSIGLISMFFIMLTAWL